VRGFTVPGGILWGEVDQFVLFRRIRGIDDNAVRMADALEDFQGIAKIPSNRDFFEIDPVICPHCRGHGANWSEQERINWQGKTLTGDLDVKTDLLVRPWPERSGRESLTTFLGVLFIGCPDLPVRYTGYRLEFRI
jgi:hypothetical protein